MNVDTVRTGITQIFVGCCELAAGTGLELHTDCGLANFKKEILEKFRLLCFIPEALLGPGVHEICKVKKNDMLGTRVFHNTGVSKNLAVTTEI